MKKLITCLILVFVSFISLAQERVNEKQYSYSTSSPLVENNIIGWIFDESSGQWVSHKNLITQYQYPWISNNGQWKNIKNISLKTVNLEDKTLYLMHITFLDGKYKYESIHEDWQTRTAELLFVLEEKDFNYIKDPEETVVEISTDSAYNYGYLYTTNELIRQIISNSYPLFHGLKFYIKRYKDVIRVNYMFANKGYDDSSLSKCYFEIPYSEWKKLSLQNKLR